MPKKLEENVWCFCKHWLKCCQRKGKQQRSSLQYKRTSFCDDLEDASLLVEALVLPNLSQRRPVKIQACWSQGKTELEGENEIQVLPEQDKDTEKRDSKDEDNSLTFLQILFFYVQDATLFKVYIPGEDDSLHMFINFLQLSPDLFLFYDNMCFWSSKTAVGKAFFKTMFGPCVVCMLSVLFLDQWFVSKFVKRLSDFWDTFKSRTYQAFLLALLFSYQRVIVGVFSLVRCVNFGSKTVLWIHAETQCYVWWQNILQVYLAIIVAHGLVFLAISPFFLETKRITPPTFVVSCIFPLPTLVYLINLHIVDKTSLSKDCQISVEDKPCEMEDEELAQEESESGLVFSKSEEAFLDLLIKYYRKLTVCGVSFVWLGVHKLYRMILVICETYISEPFPGLSTMTLFVLCMFLCVTFAKPCREDVANKLMSFSFAANIMIAVFNICKAALNAGNFESNALVEAMLVLFDVLETWLMVPLTAVALWAVFSVVKQKIRKYKRQ